LAKASNATIQTTTSGIFDEVLGTCGTFEERQVGDERFNVFEKCKERLTSTLVLRGGSEQFIAESERSVHDAFMVVKHCLQSHAIVAGGGAVEMGVSNFLRSYATSIKGKGQLIITAFAKALEVIPRQLCDNAGYDSIDILSALRKIHSCSDKEDATWYGVDIVKGGICDTFEAGVWEPRDNKCNSVVAATEAACTILSIDETVINPKTQDPGGAGSPGLTGRFGGGKMTKKAKTINPMDVANMGGVPRSGNLSPGISYMKGRGGG